MITAPPVAFVVAHTHLAAVRAMYQLGHPRDSWRYVASNAQFFGARDVPVLVLGDTFPDDPQAQAERASRVDAAATHGCEVITPSRFAALVAARPAAVARRSERAQQPASAGY